MIKLETIQGFFSERKDLLNEILGRYPDYGRRSAIMPLLWEVQNAEKHVSEARVEEIAQILDVHATEVKGVMTFYSTYHEQPIGKYHLQICATLSCALAGSDEMYDFISEETGLVNGETDGLGLFSIQKVECLGSCGTAPVLQVNDTYFERVTKSRCKALLGAMRSDEMPEVPRERGGDNEGAEKPNISGKQKAMSSEG